MGKECLGGTEEDTRPDPAHRRELASAAMAEKKTTFVRGLNECKTKQRGGGSVVGDATWRQGEHGARHPGSCSGAAETDVDQAVSGAVRGLHVSAWAACEHVGRPGRKRWVEPRETLTFSIYSD
jgi:hypothetical protein